MVFVRYLDTVTNIVVGYDSLVCETEASASTIKGSTNKETVDKSNTSSIIATLYCKNTIEKSGTKLALGSITHVATYGHAEVDRTQLHNWTY